MDYQAVKVKGWNARKLTAMQFYQCPGCGSCQEMLWITEDGACECYRCEKKFPRQEFKGAMRRRTVVVCASCTRGVELVSSNFGMAGLGFICSGCSNYVAVLYGNRFANPTSVLDVGWNPTVFARGKCVSPESLRFVRCRTEKDFLVLKVLQAIVKEEDSRFLFVRKEEQHRAALLFDCRKRRYLGFLVWTEDKFAVLRQIFVVEDERRQGYAEKMLTFWMENYADRLHERFGIEAPNERALSLHLKLGHLRVDGDSYVGIKCFPV
jgi:GNAT superfamily N-acetyltransferase